MKMLMHACCVVNPIAMKKYTQKGINKDKKIFLRHFHGFMQNLCNTQKSILENGEILFLLNAHAILWQ
jgi:hypothetical protein